jgi:hypothetical protein
MGGSNPVLADNRRTARSVSVLVPVVTLVFACTAIPIQVQPWSAADLAGIFHGKLDVPDIVANVAGFAPLGMVFASRGAWPAIALATALSSFSEATQLFSRGRSIARGCSNRARIVPAATPLRKRMSTGVGAAPPGDVASWRPKGSRRVRGRWPSRRPGGRLPCPRDAGSGDAAAVAPVLDSSSMPRHYKAPASW